MFTAVPATLILAATAVASPIDAAFPTPTLDRWMYPFNATPGTSLVAPTFGAVGFAGFDDRDSQLIIGFDTWGEVPAGLGAAAYRVTHARVRITVAGGEFDYDPTHDSLATYLPPENPGHADDDDAGRPVEIFGMGYRNGQNLGAFTETSEFGGEPIVPPAEGARNAFAAILDDQGNATDASRHVRLGFEATPLATGASEDSAPGEPVAPDTEFWFDLDTCSAGAKAYLATALDAGRLNLAVSSLHDTAGGPGGPQSYPVWYTRENPLAQAPFDRTARLEITVVVNDDPDLTGDGILDLFDFLAFQNLFVAGSPIADFDSNCQFDLFDFLAYVNAFNK